MTFCELHIDSITLTRKKKKKMDSLFIDVPYTPYRFNNTDKKKDENE